MVVNDARPTIIEYHKMDETNLVYLARGGDREVYREIYNRFGPPIMVHMYGIIKNREETEELRQILFGEKLPKNIGKLCEEAKSTGNPIYLSAWLHKVARNMAFNFLRDSARRRAILERGSRDEGESRYYTPDHRDAFTEFYAKERGKDISEALTKLTPAHRQILELRYGEDMSYNEIAETLGIKAGTVMSRLNRAQNYLLTNAPELEELLAG